MKLIGETRFDITDEDAKEHAVPVNERYGLALVFACESADRPALKQWAETLTDPVKKMVLVPLERLKAMEKAAAGIPTSIFDIPGVYVTQYEMMQRERDFFTAGGQRETSFRERGIRVRIDVETNDSSAAEQLMQTLAVRIRR